MFNRCGEKSSVTAVSGWMIRAFKSAGKVVAAKGAPIKVA
jgi:hypothetical protein